MPAETSPKSRKLRKDFFDLADMLLMCAPCQHENCGTCWQEGVKIMQCLDCDKILYRGQGGPDPDHPANGC